MAPKFPLRNRRIFKFVVVELLECVHQLKQSKISACFRSSSISSTDLDPPTISEQDDDGLAIWEKAEHRFVNTCKRRAPKTDMTALNAASNRQMVEKHRSESDQPTKPDVKNKKRKYAQYYLEFGQSDFLLHYCSTCGIKYAPGDDDEKAHKVFHKNYIDGILFKVEEVLKMMEIELGNGWIPERTVYFFIASQRVVGCLFAGLIKKRSELFHACQTKKCDITAINKDLTPNSSVLQFGNVRFQREIITKLPADDHHMINLSGAILCENVSVPAVCSIRAIGVTPSNRRKGIAVHLLDAARKSFSRGNVIERWQLAFSQATSAGSALAAKFTGTSSFPVFKSNNEE